MNRRIFMQAALQTVAATALPPAMHAQGIRTRPVRIGMLAWGRATPGPNFIVDELEQLGYVVGRDLVVERHFADGNAAALSRLASQLVQDKVDLIVAAATPAVHAAKAATKDIPIVMSNVADPVSTGLVDSLARPGGNITGVTFFGPAAAGKRIELLKQIVPGLQTIGFLGSSDDPNTATFVREIEAAANQMSYKCVPILIKDANDFANTFQAFQGTVQAVMVQPIFIIDFAADIARLALQHALPTISDEVRFPRAGGLLSYGVDWPTLNRRAAHFVDRIIKGARPADLPVELPTNYQLIINTRTAKALGLIVPSHLLALADDLIE
jgi:putative ABC transport system substrate-binding protein